MADSSGGSASWPMLLDHACELLADAERRAGQPIAWTIGGGTVLMWHYTHRTSRDIDVFLHDAQVLTRLTPRLNDRAAALAADYVEASNFVKLAFPEGEIDFIVAPSLTPHPTETRTAGSHRLRTDAPTEIAAKKAFYRAADLRPRDVFDLAVVIDRESAARGDLARVLTSKRMVLEERLRAMAGWYASRARQEIAVLPAGEPYVERALDDVRAFIARLG